MIILKTKPLIVLAFTALFILVCLLPVNCLSEEVKSVSAEVEKTVQSSEFVYNPVGLRDPFAPLVQKIRQSVAKPRRNLGPLEKYELSQFRLLAMMIVDGNPRAMVKAPDGKSYTLTVSPETLIGRNNGVVTRIETKTFAVDQETGQRIEKNPDRVVVLETGIDNYTGKEFKTERYIEM